MLHLFSAAQTEDIYKAMKDGLTNGEHQVGE